MKKFSFLDNLFRAPLRAAGNTFALHGLVQFLTIPLIAISMTACLDPVGKMDNQVVSTIEKKFILPAVVSPKSALTPANATVVADGTTAATITVTLIDLNTSAPVAGKTVALVSNRAGDTIAAPSGPSDALGIVTFAVTSKTPGVAVFTATDSTDSIPLISTAAVTWTPSNGPTVTGVTTTTSTGSYKAAAAVNVTVNFSAAVTVTGTPQITLATTPNQAVNYVSGSGSTALVFTYTVQPGDTSARLDYLNTTALALGGGTIKGASLGDAVLTLPATGTSALYTAHLTIDTTAPTIASVTTTTSSGSYPTGANVNVTVNFSEAVIVTGTPQITLSTSPNKTVNYVSGSGSSALVFTYTVAPGDSTPRLDYLSTAALALNGGTITDAALNIATLTLPTTGTSGLYAANISIDTTAPTVASVTTTTSSGSYKAAAAVNVTVTFSKTVWITGTPQITLGTTPNQTVSYVSGSGSSALVFTYTVQPGDVAARLDYLNTAALALNGGTIKDAPGNSATLTLPAAGTSGLYAANIVIDATAPTIASVTTTTVPGSYKATNAVNVTVNFSKAVTVTGVPQLTLNTTATNEIVNYVSGSGTSALVFTYTVQSGDTSARLDYKNTTALALNGGSIKDAASNNAILTLPATGTSGLYTTNIIIDTTAPTVASVTTTTATGYYKAAAVINVTIGFSEAVGITGTPQLTLGTTPSRVASYVSGTGTNSLIFTYTVQSGDNDARLDYASTAALALSGGLIQDAAGNNATLTLPATGTSGLYTTNIIIDTTAPTIASVTTTTAAGAYTVAAAINVTVNFSESVLVTGTPQMTLGTTPNRVVNYASGSGTNALVFTYTVQSGDIDARLDYLNTTALTLNGGTVTDAALNNAVLTLPGTGTSGLYSTNIAVNTATPTVASVSSTTATGSYGPSAAVNVTVNFSEAVTVTGTPQITLATTPNRAVSYASGSGTTALVFTYTVQSGDLAAHLDYLNTTALALNSGTIKNNAGNVATLTLPATTTSAFYAKNLVIDTTAPTVASVTTTTSGGSYKAASAVNVTVNFSKSVLVTGTPQITLNTTATNAVVSYSSGSGSNALVFTYTVGASDTSARLDYTSTTALALNSGTIKDAAGNVATLTLPGTGTSGLYTTNIIIDTTAPTVASVTTTTTAGSYKAGTAINVTVNFSEAVTVTGTPQITLNTTATNEVVNYASGSGSTALVFTYTVQAGDTAARLNYLSTGSLALNSGAITDAALNNAVLTLPTLTSSGIYTTNIIVDTTAPTVASVTTTTAAGSYTTAAAINVTVNFSENVTVTGTPQITLATTPNRVVNYASGSGTTALVFTYTLQSGDTAARLDYLNTAALALNSGTIKDPAGNNATLTLPGTGTSGLYSTNIIIDTIQPTVASVTTTTATGAYRVAGVVNVTIGFSKNVTVTGTPQITLNTTATNAVVNYASGSGTSALVFTYTVGASDTSSHLDYVSTGSLALNGGTIKDAATNSAVLTLPATASSGLYTTNIIIDQINPSITITSPTGGTTISQNSGNLTTTYSGNTISSQTLTVSFTGACYNNASTIALYIDSTANTAWGTGSCSAATATGQTCTGGNCGTYTIGSLNALSLSAGTHSIIAVATDAAMRTAQATVSVTRNATYYLGRNFYTYKPVASGGGPTSDLSTSASAIYVPVGSNGASAVGGAYQDADVTIYRDVAAASGAATVTLTPALVSASSTDLPSVSAFTVSFAQGATYAMATATNFGIAYNSAVTGDKYFTVKISAPTNSGEILTTTGFGTQAVDPVRASQAQINIIDPNVEDNSASPAPYGNYMFGHSLFTVNQGQTNGTVTVQKLQGLAASSTVVLTLVDGSAAAGTDYYSTSSVINCGGGGSNTVTFASNIDEVTCTIKTYATGSPSSSFYAKLTSPSAGTSMRPQSVAKVRILDTETVDRVTTISATKTDGTCYALNTNTSYSGGFGGGDGSSGTPYLICSLAQLNRLNAFTVSTPFGGGSNFRMSVDIDASYGTLTVIPKFYGNFDGNERTILNYNNSGTTCATYCGFFGQTFSQSYGGYIKGINLLYYNLTSNADYAGAIVGYNNGGSGLWPSLYSNDYASGYLVPTTGYGGGIAGAQATAGTTASAAHPADASMTNILTAGTIACPYNGGHTFVAGAVGYFSVSNTYSTANLTNIMSAMSIALVNNSGADGSGGIIGALSGGGTNPIVINNLDSRALVSSAVNSSDIGGIIGWIISNSWSITIENSVNYGVIQTGSGGGIAGGIVGNIANGSTSYGITLTNNTNYGPINSGSQIAGIVGALSAAYTLSVTGNSNAGSIKGTSDVAGILGNFTNAAVTTNATATFSANTNTGALTANNTNVGGLIGLATLTGASSQLIVNNTGGSCSNSGAVTATSASKEDVGGLIGQLAGAGTNTTTTLHGCTNSGSVTGSGNAGGLGGLLGATSNTGRGDALTIEGCSNSGAIASTWQNFGGLVGGFAIGASSQSLTINATGGTCSNSGPINAANGTAGEGCVGGILGYVSGASTYASTSVSIDSCSNTSTGIITNGGSYIGGILGYYSMTSSGGSNTLSITNSSNAASISSASTGGAAGYGGIAGYITGVMSTMTLTGNSNSGSVTDTLSYEAGGIVGLLNPTGTSQTVTVTKNYNTGPISATAYAGGIVGLATMGGATTTMNIASTSSGTRDCYNTGTISTGTTAASLSSGGIAGEIRGAAVSGAVANINYCDNYGAVTGGGTGTQVGGQGGIVGAFSPAVGTGQISTLNILGSKNYGDVNSVSGMVGGILGTLRGPNSSYTTAVTNITGCQSIYGTNPQLGGTTGTISCGVWSSGGTSGGTLSSACNMAGGILGGCNQNGITTFIIASTGCAGGATTGTPACTIDSLSNSPIYGNQYLGGIVGHLYLNGVVTGMDVSITDTKATGPVTTAFAGYAYAGGAIGGVLSGANVTSASSITLQRLFTTGNVTGVVSASSSASTGSVALGGVIGLLSLTSATASGLSTTISQLSSTGNVTGGSAATGDKAFYGGVLGEFYGVTGDTRTITDISATGQVNNYSALTPTLGSNTTVGGLVGGTYTYGTLNISRGYFSGTLNTGTSAGIIATASGIMGIYGALGTLTDTFFSYVSGGQNTSVILTGNDGATNSTGNANGLNHGVTWLSTGNFNSVSYGATWNGLTTTTPDTVHTWYLYANGLVLQ